MDTSLLSPSPASTDQHIQLLDWRRRVAELYARVRAERDPERGWHLWRNARERLFVDHPLSPLPIAKRSSERLPRYYAYDPACRVLVDVESTTVEITEVPTSHGGVAPAVRSGSARFKLGGRPCRLTLHWLTDYAGGLLIMFRDTTSGDETSGSGRYLIDTAKGADLGGEGGRLVLDFNFAYQPSCSYDASWNCPVAPRENWLEVPVRAGERIARVEA